MERFHKSISSYQMLTAFGTSVMPQIRAYYIEERMHKDATPDHAVVENVDGFETFGITIEHYPQTIRDVARLNEVDEAANVLPGVTLPP